MKYIDTGRVSYPTINGIPVRIDISIDPEGSMKKLLLSREAQGELAAKIAEVAHDISLKALKEAN